MKKRADARRERRKRQGLTEQKEKGFARNLDYLRKIYKVALQG